jgi:hypothetical protein
VTVTASQAIEKLTGLLPLGEALRRAASGQGLAPVPQNAHVHLPPNFTAFETVEQAVRLAAEQGVGVLGASNYYDYEAYGEFAEQCIARGVFPLFGLEVIALDKGLVAEGVKLNDPGNPGKMYICGKGIARFGKFTPRAAELIDAIRGNDAERIDAMICALEAIFRAQSARTGLTSEGVMDRVTRRHGCPRSSVYLQERHVCQAFQEVFFETVPVEARAGLLAAIYGALPKAPVTDAVATQNEIRSQLMKTGKPAFVAERFLTPAEARELILELGGIPCYPTLADGVKPICGFEEPVEGLIERLAAQGFACAEFIPLRNKPEVLEQYVTAMRRAGLVVAAGTEHNTLDLVPIEPTCVGGSPVPTAAREIFWEGACVIAAHQFLVMHGQPGYVDATGKPNAAYPDAESRIAAFKKLGEAVIGLYREKTMRS